MATKKRECAYCGKWFFPPRKTSKYCSTVCRDEARKNRGVKKCPQCGRKFEYHLGAQTQKVYCSKACYDKAQTTLKNKACIYCWKSFHPKRESAKYCSQKCYFAATSRGLKVVKCEWCWKKFEQRRVWNTCCSRECAHKAITKKDIECPVCWKMFHPDWQQKYCSQECSWKAHSVYMKDKRESSSTEEKQTRVKNLEPSKDNRVSKTNAQYKSYLEDLGFVVKEEHPLWWLFYDLKVWNVLIEINPYSTHNVNWIPQYSEGLQPHSKDYHYNKLKLARDNWYRCIMLRDWDDRSKIPYLLDEKKETLYARKCEVKQITREECHNFFESYHLQGDTVKNKNNIYIWLYYNNELVECMSFWLPRYNKNYEREILRLCTHKDYRVVWWADKIFKHFLKLTNANSVISYCDMSKFDWKVYEQLGFKLLKWNKPSKHWYNEKEIESRKHITDNFLRQRWYDQIFSESYGKGTNNDELMKQRGYVEIYDCGQATFIWTKS